MQIKAEIVKSGLLTDCTTWIFLDRKIYVVGTTLLFDLCKGKLTWVKC